MHSTMRSDTRIGVRAGAPTVRRLLAAMVAALQLLLALSPLLDRDAGKSAVAHVEQQGVQLHWSHDSAECAGCVVRLIGAAPPAPPVPELSAPAHASPEPVRLAIADDDAYLASHYSRAPPFVS